MVNSMCIAKHAVLLKTLGLAMEMTGSSLASCREIEAFDADSMIRLSKDFNPDII